MTLHGVCAACSWLRVCGAWLSRVRDLKSNSGSWCMPLWRKLCDRLAKHVLLHRRSLVGSGRAAASKPRGTCHRAVRVWGNPCMCASERLSILPVRVHVQYGPQGGWRNAWKGLHAGRLLPNSISFDF